MSEERTTIADPTERADHPPIAVLEFRRDVLMVMLTLVTGATDALGFVRLGGVFTSVMTGNMVLVGIAAGKGEGTLAIHTGVAFAAYVLGSLLGAAVARDAEHSDSRWPGPFQAALLVEFALFALFALGWEVAGARPTSNETFGLLALNAVALGIQSSAVQTLGVSGLSTTYLTGTLTTVVAGLSRHTLRPGTARSMAILAALIGGAALGAFVTVDAPRAAPAIQLGILGLVIVIGWRYVAGNRPKAGGGRAATPTG